MLENHTIAHIAGIPIRANLLLGYLLGLWAVYGAAQGHAAQTGALIVLSTLLLLLHELGHAFVARRLGLDVVDIVLWPLGGMARISNMPDNPRIEAWVAAAGPLVNLGLAALAAPLLWLPSQPADYQLQLPGFNVPVAAGAAGVVTLFVVINLAYGLLNLLPAFPMDGGRLLRAFLGRGGRSWLSATDRATSVGAWIAWTVILISLFQGACFLSLVGFFILWAGLRERWVVRLHHQAEAHGGARGRFAGWESLLRQMQRTPDGEAPSTPRPSMGSPAAEPGDASGVGHGGRGFTEADVERLESFRGRLRRDGGPDEDETAS